MPEDVQELKRASASARESFLRAEICQRVRQALRHNIRPGYQSLEFRDILHWYTLDGDWKGPAKIVGVAGQVSFARHGCQNLRVHCKNCMKETTESKNPSSEAQNRERKQLLNSVPETRRQRRRYQKLKRGLRSILATRRIKFMKKLRDTKELYRLIKRSPSVHAEIDNQISIPSVERPSGVHPLFLISPVKSTLGNFG